MARFPRVWVEMRHAKTMKDLGAERDPWLIGLTYKHNIGGITWVVRPEELDTVADLLREEKVLFFIFG